MKFLVAILLISTLANASYQEAARYYGRGKSDQSASRRMILELSRGGYPFATIPWIKDYLVKGSGPLDSEFLSAFDKVLSVSTVKLFEALPEKSLSRSRSGNVRFILAKKFLKQGMYPEALNEIKNIPEDHPNYSFVAHLKGTLYSYIGNLPQAKLAFQDCVRYSERELRSSEQMIKTLQLEINRDYCVAGIARNAFEAKDYTQADLLYLDIPKTSYIWPEILFEEAWNSYYQKNYNRTLGKLVSYKAPVFSYVFNPEVEVLKALSYLKLCLFADTKKTVDDFYSDYYNEAKNLRQFLSAKRSNYKYFYQLMTDFENHNRLPVALLSQLLHNTSKEATFQDMKATLNLAMNEYNKIRNLPTSSFRSALIRNIKAVIEDLRRAIGAHVRNSLVNKYADLHRAFEGMSYIKLEVLAQRKERLYRTDAPADRKRGDVKYIDRNDKQYFWDFNGEFWADELGDYVFALGSEC